MQVNKMLGCGNGIPRGVRASLAMLAAVSTAFAADTLELVERNQTVDSLAGTTVTLRGRSELRLTGSGDPLAGSTVHLNSPDGWVVFTALRPSEVAATMLGRMFVDGAPASLTTNTRVVAFGNGAVVIPHGPDFEPLTIFSGRRFSGEAATLPLYTYHSPDNLAALPQGVASFRLRRGYMATFAEHADGTGHSQVFVAQDDDVDVPVMPATLARNTRFIRVFPWRWTAKKGYAGGNLGEAERLDAKWRYNWNNNSESNLDIEYVPIRQTRWWPSHETTNAKRNVTHLLAFNEPDSSAQANMTVAQAIAEWPNLLRSGLRLGSPAPTDGGLNWLYQFIDEADARDYRVDYVVVHFYRGGQTLAQFQNFMTQVHQRTGRPLWLKEFNNGANWTCCLPTYQQNAQVIGQWIQWMDETPWIERYSIYRWVEAQRDMFYGSGSHTPAGLVYLAQQSPVAYHDHPPQRTVTTYADPRLQANNINHVMPYDSDPGWTTGIGQTLGNELVLSRAQFETRLAAADGHGGVVDFERGKLAGGAEGGARGFTAMFDDGRRVVHFTSPDGHGGSYALTGPRGDRTAVSGERYLSRSGNPHFDFEIEPGTGMDAREKVTAVALTALGRNGVSGTQRFRFTAWFTDGSDIGSSSARRAINTSTGNGSADTFAAITAPDGWWINRVSLRSENGAYTSIDDLAFITSQIGNTLEWQPDGFPGGSGEWDASTTPSWSGGPWVPGRDAHFPAPAGAVVVGEAVGGIAGITLAAGGYQFSGSGSMSFEDGAEIHLAGGNVVIGVPFGGAPRIHARNDGPPRQLRLTADNRGFTGTLHAGPGIQIRAYQAAGRTATGQELGGAATTIHLADGAQIRWFNPAADVAYPPAMIVAGNGHGNPGVINIDSNTRRTITLAGPLTLEAAARIATQNAGNLIIAGAIDGAHTLTASPAPGTHIRLDGAVTTTALEISGAGTLTLAGDADITGSTSIQNGTLRVDGTLTASHVTVGANATLTGTGSIPAATVRGTLALEAGQPLTITGPLALENATLAISGTPAGSQITILATHGGLTGVFAEVTGVPDGWTLDTAHAEGTAIALLPAGFSAWAATHLGGQGPNDDFHGDGIPNLLRYALDIDAAKPSGFPGTFAHGTLTFRKRPEAVANADITYTLQTSPDLSPDSWLPVAAGTDDAHVIAIDMPAAGPRQFLRLAVEWSD